MNGRKRDRKNKKLKYAFGATPHVLKILAAWSFAQCMSRFVARIVRSLTMGTLIIAMLSSCALLSKYLPGERGGDAIRSALYIPGVICSYINGQRYDRLKAMQNDIIVRYGIGEIDLADGNALLDSYYAADDNIRNVVSAEFLDNDLQTKHGTCYVSVRIVMELAKEDPVDVVAVRHEFTIIAHEIESIMDDMRILGYDDLLDSETPNGINIGELFREFKQLTEGL